MPLIKFLDYRPDVSDSNESYTALLRNVIPRSDGYGPFNDLAAFTASLPDVCRGAIRANAQDGSIVIFAATVNRLYILDNSTLAWTDVSKDGSAYADLNPDANWVFVQFNNVIVATQKNVVMQIYDLASSSAFDDLGGSPPQAGWVGVVGGFLVACDLLDNPLDVRWSGLNAITTWTSGQSLSDFQTMSTGGRVRAVMEIANNVGIICQDSVIRRMVFAPGSDVIFQIDILVPDRGILGTYSLCVAGGLATFLSTRGFVQVDANGALSTIGEERIDRTMLGQHDTSVDEDIRNLAYDPSNPQLVIGSSDPSKSLLLFVYKSLAGVAAQFDRGFLYHTTLTRWSPVEIAGQYLVPMAKPGLTLESLDAIAPNAQTISNAADNGSGLIRLTVSGTTFYATGQIKAISGVVGTTEANGNWPITLVDSTHIDLVGSSFANDYVSGGIVGGNLDRLKINLDSISTASLPAIAAFTALNELGFLSGDTLEAELYTAEQSAGGPRIRLNNVMPITDATNVYCSVIKRENLNAEDEDGDESLMDGDGNCWLLEDTRFGRIKQRVPAGEHWTFAKGVIPDAGPGSGQ